MLVLAAYLATGFQNPRSTIFHYNTARSLSSWGIGDSWDSLSSDNPDNFPSSSILNQDLALLAARELEERASFQSLSEEEQSLKEMIDNILGGNEKCSCDDSEGETRNVTFEDEMGREIAMLVRCNESPEDLLISEGRALPPLTDADRNDVTQLVSLQPAEDGGIVWEATPFFKDAVSQLFHKHSMFQMEGTDIDKNVKIMKPLQVAAWMKQALGPEEGRKNIGPHDKRVLHLISRYGKYGTGYLTDDDFQNLYLSTILGDGGGTKINSYERLQKFREKEILAVWRDLRNHKIESPVEVEHAQLVKDLELKHQHQSGMVVGNQLLKGNLVDECEIVEEGAETEWSTETASWTVTEKASGRTRKAKSSHELVELANDGETPLYIRDGEFGKFFYRCNLSSAPLTTSPFFTNS